MHNKRGRRHEGREREGQTVGNRDNRRSVEGKGMGRWVHKMDTTRTFRTLHNRELSGRKAGNVKEVGLGWINGGRKDRGFG